jgi:hypothetical protein
MTPLTHHEILRVVAPFTQRGLRLDLAASNRLERRLVFRPIKPAGETTDAPRDRTVFMLETPRSEAYRLTRVVVHETGIEARLETDGTDPEELLERIGTIVPNHQFRSGAGHVIAFSHRLEPIGDPPSSNASALLMVLTGGVARLADVTLTLRMPTVRGFHADLELVATDGGSLDLTEDLLAVLGTDWAMLRRSGSKWVSTVRPHGREPDRSRRAEEMFDRTADHLARTLAEPPSHFHARLYRARWGVVMRRAIPLLVSIALLVGSLALSKIDLAPDSALWVLMFHAPPLMLIAFFCMREIPRIEIPPLPRASPASAWRPPAAAALGVPAATDIHPT